MLKKLQLFLFRSVNFYLFFFLHFSISAFTNFSLRFFLFISLKQEQCCFVATGEFQIGEEDSEPLDPNSAQSIVQYGEFNARTRNNHATGHSLVYNQQYPGENGLKNYTSGIIHHVQLTGLKPNTLYRYRCGEDPSSSAMSREYYFRTMPKSTSEDYPRRIVVAGDLGLTYNTSTVLTHILSNHPDLVVLIGGFSYADTYLANKTKLVCTSCYCNRETYQPRWDYWGR